MGDQMDDLQHEKLILEKEKLKLENQKIAEETKTLKRFAQKWGHLIPPIAALIVALFTIIFYFSSGLFSLQKMSLENQKTLLQIEINNASKINDSIKKESVLIRQERDRLQREKDALLKKYAQILAAVKLLKANYEKDKADIGRQLADIDLLLRSDKTAEAFKQLKAVIKQLNGITGRSFNDDFSDEFQ
ncbi:MAG: hypothetical protein JWN76_1365 [Chitinophagaceae bacterium]|nr:hypothetical protein [Chitinophagaceae bacterium]